MLINLSPQHSVLHALNLLSVVQKLMPCGKCLTEWKIAVNSVLAALRMFQHLKFKMKGRS